jgi:hypothetical protein
VTRRITGDDLRTYSAGLHGDRAEPYRSEMGYGPYYDVLARLVNQAEALDGYRVLALGAGAVSNATTLQHVWEGVMVSLGEILADRIQDKPHLGDGEDELAQAQWNDLCCFRAHGYLEWAKGLLERET